MRSPSIECLRNRLAAAQRKADAACARRASLPPGSSRARVTSANARWAIACEARDRSQRAVEEAEHTMLIARNDAGRTGERGFFTLEASPFVFAALFAIGLALGAVVRLVSIGTYADCEQKCKPLSVAEFQPSAIPVCRCGKPSAEVTP